ncbi:Zn-dependent hydrolase [Verminephrobacter eiseniae]|uniref:M20 family metallo-hydrolase n=1 Tax=Verminephrobacter eiseniae TaxID=364317 RepID=UPI0022383E0B|nr:M20 family metallo-hydrolase [Verminephrobacter eiseniae]MCW5234071.1 Zn-dependent hydrolase [Verminephrobacter eiseniae]
MPLLKVNRERLKRSMDQISTIGATPRGGMHRLALGDKDRQARDLLKRWCMDAGFPVRVDPIGNMFARRAGRHSDSPPVVIGSHLDSQCMAGRFDGPVGVIAALEVLRTLDDQRVVTQAPIDLVNWTNEEGARFSPPLLGSGVFTGAHDLDFALRQTDKEGLSVQQELVRIGYAGAGPVTLPVRKYIELHIEQGVVLEQAAIGIGVVTGFVGIRDTKVTVLGQSTHAGPLAMDSRRDALVGAAGMILAARAIGLAHGPDARVTIGKLAIPSDSHSVVPGCVEMVLDVRHPDAHRLDAVVFALQQRFRAMATDSGLAVHFEDSWYYPPVVFDSGLRSQIAEAAAGFGYSHMELPSRAGHDALNMARVAPTAMIFIPCRAGLSHNELEFAEDQDIAAGADVLLAAALAAAR